jgi:tetratricopeptide (TPR) repeat protein
LGWGAGEVAALLGLLVLLAAILGGLYLDHPSAMGGAWFVLAIIPGVGIFPSAHYHDSQTLYLAIWGAAFALTYGITRIWRPIGRQLMPGSEGIIFVPLIIVLSVITGLSNARWWNHEGLFESEIAMDPHYMEGRLQLAEAALDRGEPTVALNHVLAAIEASGDENYTGYWSARDAYYLAGRAQWELDLFTEAAGSLTSALQQSPGDADILYWIGLTQLSLQEFGPAEASLRQALEARPRFPNAAADLGVALVGQQRFVEAYPLLADAIAQDLGNARRHRAMALTLIDANRLQEAAEQLELALATREDADERARLAWVSWRLGELERARSDLNMALMMEEESSPYVEWVRVQIQSAAGAAGPE